MRLGAVEAVEDGGGPRLSEAGGGQPASHSAFWFAWSQLHPGTGHGLAGER